MKQNDVAMTFYLTVTNAGKLPIRLFVNGTRCCQTIVAGDEDCESMKLMGGDMGRLFPQDSRNLTLLYVNLYLHNRVGSCEVEIKSDKVERGMLQTITFDTRLVKGEKSQVPPLLEKYYKPEEIMICNGVDLDPLNACQPYICGIRYDGVRSQYNPKTQRCEIRTPIGAAEFELDFFSVVAAHHFIWPGLLLLSYFITERYYSWLLAFLVLMINNPIYGIYFMLESIYLSVDFVVASVNDFRRRKRIIHQNANEQDRVLNLDSSEFEASTNFSEADGDGRQNEGEQHNDSLLNPVVDGRQNEGEQRDNSLLYPVSDGRQNEGEQHKDSLLYPAGDGRQNEGEQRDACLIYPAVDGRQNVGEQHNYPLLHPSVDERKNEGVQRNHSLFYPATDGRQNEGEQRDHSGSDEKQSKSDEMGNESRSAQNVKGRKSVSKGITTSSGRAKALPNSQSSPSTSALASTTLETGASNIRDRERSKDDLNAGITTRSGRVYVYGPVPRS